MPARSGQGSLEYLLLIGGAVVVGSIVIVLLLGAGGSGSQSTKSSLDALNEKKAAAGFDTGLSLVSNSSFEHDSTSSISSGQSPWIQETSNDWSIVSGNCYNGNNCLKLSNNACTGVYQYIPISTDVPYYASVYVKGNCMLHAHLINSTCPSGFFNISYFAGKPVNASSWQKVSGTVQINSASNTVTTTDNYGAVTTSPFSSQSCTDASKTTQIMLFLLNCGYAVTGNDYCDMVTFRQN